MKALRKLQHEMDEAQARRPRPKRDPESRQKLLDEAIEEAKDQARHLEASSAASTPVDWDKITAGGLAVFGVLCLGGAVFWSRRGR